MCKNLRCPISPAPWTSVVIQSQIFGFLLSAMRTDLNITHRFISPNILHPMPQSHFPVHCHETGQPKASRTVHRTEMLIETWYQLMPCNPNNVCTVPLRISSFDGMSSDTPDATRCSCRTNAAPPIVASHRAFLRPHPSQGVLVCHKHPRCLQGSPSRYTFSFTSSLLPSS